MLFLLKLTACSPNCVTGTCDQGTGICVGCTAGFMGANCTQSKYLISILLVLSWLCKPCPTFVLLLSYFKLLLRFQHMLHGLSKNFMYYDSMLCKLC